MIATITLTNTQFAMLLFLAVIGLYQMLFARPVRALGKWEKEKADPTVVERVNESLGVYGDAMKKFQ